MRDSRFVEEAHDLDDLLATLDVDELGDIEVLLMIMFQRDISVEMVEDEEGELVVEATVWTGEMGIGVRNPFPVSVLSLVGTCAETITELDYGDGPEGEGNGRGRAVMEMSNDELCSALQDALGKVRIFNVLQSDE